MAFDPTRLFQQLQNTGLAIKDQQLYQLLKQMIQALGSSSSPSGGSGGTTTNISNVYNNILNPLGFSPDDTSYEHIDIPGPQGIQGIQGTAGSSGVAGIGIPGMDGEDASEGLTFAFYQPSGYSGLIAYEEQGVGANLAGLNTTPRKIIPGFPNKVIIPVIWTLELTGAATGATWTNSNSSPRLRYGSSLITGANITSNPSSPIMALTANAKVRMIVSFDDNVTNLAAGVTMKGQDLYLATDADIANPGTGTVITYNMTVLYYLANMTLF